MNTPHCKQLLQDIANEKDLYLRIEKFADFATIFIDSTAAELVPLLEEYIELCKSINFLDGEIRLRFIIGFIQGNLKNFTEAEKHLNYAHTNVSKVTNIGTLGSGSMFMAYGNWYKGEYDIAFNLMFEALKNLENVTNRSMLGWANYSIATFYFDIKDIKNSLEYYTKSKQIFEELKNDYGVARSTNGLASIKILQDELEEAENMLLSILPIYGKYGIVTGETRLLTDLGIIERRKGNHEKSLRLHLEAYEKRLSIKHIQGIITSLLELANITSILGNYEAALAYAKDACKMSEESNTKAKLFQAHQLLSTIYKQTEDPWNALAHLERFYEIKSEILGEQASNKMKALQTKFATHSAEKEAEIERLKSVELKKAYDEIELKNHEITQSIQYAQKIQSAILPSEEIFASILKDSFILFKPKDIVSGDYYWISDRENHIYYATADCTGHGVPGGFMSMLGTALLNEIIDERKIEDCGEALTLMREKIMQALKQAGDSESKDGMDMVLIRIDKKTLQMQYAAANNSMYVVSNKQSAANNEYCILQTADCQLFELPCDKMPVGIYHSTVSPFKTSTYQLAKGDIIYTYTDGFADQFGGEKGKKYTYKRLREKLMEISQKPLAEQKKELENGFMSWKGDNEQIDDICLIGVKI